MSPGGTEGLERIGQVREFSAPGLPGCPVRANAVFMHARDVPRRGRGQASGYELLHPANDAAKGPGAVGAPAGRGIGRLTARGWKKTLYTTST